MKANFHISLRIIRGLLHIQMSVNMLYSKADYLEHFCLHAYYAYMLIMHPSHFLASISLLLQFLSSYSDDLMLFLFLAILNL